MTMRIGGLISGIDTESYISAIREQKSVNLNALERRQEKLEEEKNTILEVNKELLAFKNVTLPLRLESTFKNRTATSTDETIITASAGLNAGKGTYGIQVHQVARESRAQSLYVRAFLEDQPPNSAGVTKISGRPEQNVSGKYEVELTDAQTASVQGGVAIESARYAGRIAYDINAGEGNNELRLWVSGEEVTITLEDTVGDTTQMETVAEDIQTKINAALNTALGSTDKTYIRVNPADTTGANNDAFIIEHNFSGEANTIEIDYTSSAAAYLGFDVSYDSLTLGEDARANINFTPKTGGLFRTNTAESSLEGATQGTISSNIDASNNVFSFEYNGTEVSITLDDAVANETTIDKVAYEIQTKANEELNELLNTTDVAYIIVNHEHVDGTSNDKLKIFHNGANITSDTLTNVGGSAAAALGFTAGGEIGTASELQQSVTAFSDTFESSTLSEVKILLNDHESGLLPNVLLHGFLQEGNFSIYTDSSLNVRQEVKSTFTGGANVTDDSLNLYVKGLENAGFTNKVDDSINGNFTINGQTVTIEDYSALSVNDVLAKINSAGANVVASYDATSKNFVLTSTEDGGEGSIELGAAGDTSDILMLLKLHSTAGGTYERGRAAGSIEPTEPMQNAGFSMGVTAGVFTINGISLYVNPEQDSLNDVIAKINASDAGVTASYDTLTDRFMLSATKGKMDNSQKIELGGASDTSNFFEAVNIISDAYASTSTSVDAGNHGESSISVVASYGYIQKINISAVNGSGAYHTGTMNWQDGIADGAWIEVRGGADGNTLFRWTNNTGTTITSAEEFAEAWNDGEFGVGGNWISGGGYSDIPVKAVIEEDGQISFFSAYTGVDASFTFVDAHSEADLGELGVVKDTVYDTGVGTVADGRYNALNFAYDVNNGDYILKAYTNGSDTLKLVAETSGVDGYFSLNDNEDHAYNVLQDFWGQAPVYAGGTAQEVGVSGQNAILEIDGTTYTRYTNKIDDIISEMTLEIKNVSDSIEYIEVTNNSEPVIKAIAEFIASYNKVNYLINPPLLSDEQKEYLTPLTDTQKANMTYTEIESYQQKYTTYFQMDTIRKDSSIRQLSENLRSFIFAEKVGLNDQYNAISDFYLTPDLLGLSDDAKDGYLVMNSTDAEEIEEKLRENYQFMDLIDGSETELYQFFASMGEKQLKDSTTNPATATDADYITVKEAGLARGLDDLLDKFIGIDGFLKTRTKTGGLYDQRLETLEDQIDRQTTRLDDLEQRLWNEFSRMEQQLAEVQQQGDMVTSQIQSLNNMTK